MRIAALEEALLNERLERAAASVRKALDTERRPRLANDVDHTYDDKYRLMEFVMSAAVQSLQAPLAGLGIWKGDTWQTLQQWAASGQRVTLRLAASEMCAFDKETKRDEVVSSASGSFVGSLVSRSVVTAVTEYWWDVSVRFGLSIYRGSDPEDCIDVFSTKTDAPSVRSRAGAGSAEGAPKESIGGTQTERTDPATADSSSPGVGGHLDRRLKVLTRTRDSPRSERRERDAREVDLTWLLKGTDETSAEFRIDRDGPQCRTPRRNPEVDEAVAFFESLSGWCTGVTDEFFFGDLVMLAKEGVEASSAAHAKDRLSVPRQLTRFLDALGCDLGPSVLPVAPVFDDRRNGVNSGTLQPIEGNNPSETTDDGTQSTKLLTADDVGTLTREQRRQMLERIKKSERAFVSSHYADVATGVDDAAFFTPEDAELVVTVLHVLDVCEAVIASANYVEMLLRNQLLRVVGSEVSGSDVSRRMALRWRSLFKDEYRPKPACFAVGCEGGDADGFVELRDSKGNGLIDVFTREVGVEGMRFELNASVTVEIEGRTFLHTFLRQKFAEGADCAGNEDGDLTLRLSSKPLTGYVAVLGRIGGTRLFLPSHALIVRDGFSVSIPLTLDEVPSAREFRDATAALSPEQRRFAEAFRAMQLEATLFGVLVAPIMPQLEAALYLPPQSLTRDLSLRHDLVETFADSQIPVDLLAFDEVSTAAHGTAGVLPAATPAQTKESDKVAAVRQNLNAVNTYVTARKVEEALENLARAEEGARRAVEALESFAFVGYAAPYLIGRGAALRAERKVKLTEELHFQCDRILERGETIDMLWEKSSGLEELAVHFQAKSKSLHRKSVFSNVRAPFSVKSTPRSSRSSAHQPANACSTADTADVKCANSFEEAPSEPAAVAHSQETQGIEAAADGITAGEEHPSVTNDGDPAPEDDPPDTNVGEVVTSDSCSAKPPSAVFDLPSVPRLLEEATDALGPTVNVRPVIVKVGTSWRASELEATTLPGSTRRPGQPDPGFRKKADWQRAEKNKAFDLIDAVTRSGSAQLKKGTMHVFVGGAHCFDTSVVDAVVVHNVDPIERIDAACIATVAALHDQPASFIRTTTHLS
ncbi:hypothetical protein DIPPA_19041 [Diplonema papillatum]|nr:hypothetical protein DIPPA_19041 [Diplonema papillatum]